MFAFLFVIPAGRPYSAEALRRRVANGDCMRSETCAAYIEAATALMMMPLGDDRAKSVTTTMVGIAAFAANLDAVELADDVEIAGEFVP